MKKYEIHPVAECFPLPNKEDTEALYESMGRGFDPLFPVVLDQDGLVVDGRSRLNVAEELNIEVKIRKKKFINDDEVIDFVKSCNLARRHMTHVQKVQAAAKLANVLSGNRYEKKVSNADPAKPLKNKAKVACAGRARYNNPAVTIAKAAKKLNVSKAEVMRLKGIEKHGEPEVVEFAKQSKRSLEAISPIAQRKGVKKPRETQLKELEELKAGKRKRNTSTKKTSAERKQALFIKEQNDKLYRLAPYNEINGILVQAHHFAGRISPEQIIEVMRRDLDMIDDVAHFRTAIQEYFREVFVTWIDEMDKLLAKEQKANKKAA